MSEKDKFSIFLIIVAVGIIVCIQVFRKHEQSFFKYQVVCGDYQKEVSQAWISEYGEMQYENEKREFVSVAPSCIIKVQDKRKKLQGLNSSFPFSDTISCDENCLKEGLDRKAKDKKNQDELLFFLMLAS
jgi:hypothetical protein